MRLLTLLKSIAQQLGLFEETVEVKGHTRKDGTYVKPHQAKRNKKSKPKAKRQLKRDDAVVRDLFADIEQGPDDRPTTNNEKPSETAFKPTHELLDGTLVKQNKIWGQVLPFAFMIRLILE